MQGASPNDPNISRYELKSQAEFGPKFIPGNIKKGYEKLTGFMASLVKNKQTEASADHAEASVKTGAPEAEKEPRQIEGRKLPGLNVRIKFASGTVLISTYKKVNAEQTSKSASKLGALFKRTSTLLNAKGKEPVDPARITKGSVGNSSSRSSTSSEASESNYFLYEEALAESSPESTRSEVKQEEKSGEDNSLKRYYHNVKVLSGAAKDRLQGKTKDSDVESQASIGENLVKKLSSENVFVRPKSDNDRKLGENSREIFNRKTEVLGLKTDSQLKGDKSAFLKGLNEERKGLLEIRNQENKDFRATLLKKIDNFEGSEIELELLQMKMKGGLAEEAGPRYNELQLQKKFLSNTLAMFDADVKVQLAKEKLDGLSESDPGFAGANQELNDARAEFSKLNQERRNFISDQQTE